MSVVIPSLRAAVAVPGWAKNVLWRNARAVPSLDLRFADNKSLVDAVTGASLITFTRASSGTFVDSAGVIQTAATDVPRFDHNPATGESLGLLVGEARTNLLLQSEDFGNVIWSYSAASASTNTTVAPDGTTSGDTVTSAGSAVVSQPIAKTASAITYSSSLFVKGTVTAFTFSIDDGTTTNRGRVVFNLSTETISSTNNDGAFTGTSGTITSFPNNWYRLTVTTTTNSTVVARMRLFWTGAGTSLDFWGAQLEAGAFPTSYIPTTTATTTRSASLADLISSAIANNIRSFYVEFSSPAVGTRGAASLNDNTANERADLLTSGTDPRLVVHDGGAEQANINGGTVAAGVRTRVAVRINTNDFAISINGGAVVSDTSGTLPTVDRLMFGRTQAGEYLNGRIARFTGWTGLLPDSTLQTLTQ